MVFAIKETNVTGPNCSASMKPNPMASLKNSVSIVYVGKNSFSVKVVNIDYVKAFASAVNWVDHDFGSKLMLTLFTTSPMSL